MTPLTQKRTQEFVTDLERAWLTLLRTAQAGAVSGRITFERVNVMDNRVWAERAIETIHCDAAAAQGAGNSAKPR